MVENRLFLESLLVEQGTPEWHAFRDGLIVTASGVASAVGLKDAYESRSKYYRKQKGQESPHAKGFMVNVLRYGNDHEEDARRLFEDFTGLPVLSLGLGVHPQLEWLGASPDGLVVMEDGSLALLEIKCPFSGHFATEIAEKYVTQMETQLQVMGLHTCFFMSWSPDGFSLFRYNRHDRMWNTSILPRLREFVDLYARGQDPGRTRRWSLRDEVPDLADHITFMNCAVPVLE